MIMTLIPRQQLIRVSLILVTVIMTGCYGNFGRPYNSVNQGYENRYYSNQGGYYGRPTYGYPAQGNGYQSPNYNNYSYPPYYSHHHHDNDDGRERHYDRD
jgi:hypothetical protein